jgi:hypothetical protein
MIDCKKYTLEFEEVWDGCVLNSKAPLFFFTRKFVEYHSDKFVDSSLMFYEDEKLIAVLPASLYADDLICHGGLTFGCLLYAQKIRSTTILEIFEALITYCRNQSIGQIIYKPVPSIFHVAPNQEDLYGLMVNEASLIKRELSSVIDLTNRPKLSKGRKWLVNKAKKEGVEIIVSTDWKTFYELLTGALKKHGALPTHTISELKYLYSMYPKNIELIEARKGEELLAATLLFKFGNVIHTQYMATNDTGKDLGALDYLIESCIHKSQEAGCKTFSFGISTEQDGKVLNEGLVSQKESFGARAIVLDTYSLLITADA